MHQSATTDHRRLARLIATLGNNERPERLPTFRFLSDWAFFADAGLNRVVSVSAGLLLWVEEALMASAASDKFFDLFDDNPDDWQNGHVFDALPVSTPLITPRAFAW